MPDLIVRKQDTGNIAVSTTTQNVVIQATPTNSYVLPPATASTMGGVRIGSNLTIDGTGLLSANIPPGSVTAFNNRTGNVSLTANDVLSTGTQFSQPVYDTYISANLPIGGSISGSELIRGIKIDKNWSGQTSQFYYGFFGMGFSSNFYAGVVDKATNNITSMIMLRPGADNFGGFEIIAGQKSILVSPESIQFVGNVGIGGKVFCQSSTQFGQEPAVNEVLTRQSGDARYVRISSRN